MTPQVRIRRMGWIAVLAISTVIFVLLTLKVNAVHSEVVRAERKIVSLERQKRMLEIEFETRANQAQLAAWNRVDFGYTTPTASQFLENDRQLAVLGSPRAVGAPQPIRVAGVAGDESGEKYPAFVSPLTGKPMEEALIEPETHVRAPSGAEGGATRISLGAVIKAELP